MKENSYIKPSKVHGLGLFASRDIRKGERIIHGGPNWSFQKEWIEYTKTAKERSLNFHDKYCMVNHSEAPNIIRKGKNLNMIACVDIKEGEEILEDYNKLPDEQNPFKEGLSQFFHDMRKYHINHNA